MIVDAFARLSPSSANEPEANACTFALDEIWRVSAAETASDRWKARTLLRGRESFKSLLPGEMGQGGSFRPWHLTGRVGPQPSGYGCCEFQGRCEILRFWCNGLVKSPRPVYANGPAVSTRVRELPK